MNKVFKVKWEIDPEEILEAYSVITFEENRHRKQYGLLKNMKFTLDTLKDLNKDDFTDDEWDLLEKNIGITIRGNNGRRRVDWNMFRSSDYEKDYIFKMLLDKNYLDISNVKKEFDWIQKTLKI